MLVRLKPGGPLQLVALQKTLRPGDEIDLPREIVERHAGRLEVLKADPQVASREPAKPVSEYHVGGGWYELPGTPHRVRKAEAEDILAEGEPDGGSTGAK